MSTATMKTLQRAGLAAVALFAVAGFAVDASAATVRGEQTYVPADQAATAPGTLPATRSLGRSAAQGRFPSDGELGAGEPGRYDGAEFHRRQLIAGGGIAAFHRILQQRAARCRPRSILEDR